MLLLACYSWTLWKNLCLPFRWDCRPIGTAFQSNSIIRNFNEFQYFTKLATLANNAFNGSGIAQITFPISLTTIGTSTYCHTFLDCLNLRKLIFNEGFAFAHDRCIWGCKNITLLDFPSTTTTLQGYSIQCYDSVNQKNYVIICRAITPPALGSISYTNKLTAVYVPDESVSAYKTASVWSGIAAKIKPLSEYTS